jgi:hypothetical protein
MATRLQKFIETSADDQSPGHAAYVLDVSALPQPASGKEWQRIDSFSAAEEVLNDHGLKSILKRAIEKGCAVVNEARGSAAMTESEKGKGRNGGNWR